MVDSQHLHQFHQRTWLHWWLLLHNQQDDQQYIVDHLVVICVTINKLIVTKEPSVPNPYNVLNNNICIYVI